LLLGGAHAKATAHLLLEHPTLDALIDRLQAEPSYVERVRIMREELGPWLYEYMPAVSIGPTHSICRGGAERGGLAVHPGPYGAAQLGICPPRPVAGLTWHLNK
jgi:hypothetical protein